MRVSRLQLRNYKQFHDLDLFLDPATLLVGANDAGKSTVIEALRHVLPTPMGRYEPTGRWFDVATGDGILDRYGKGVSIVATFSGLIPDELLLAYPLLGDHGHVRLGRMWLAKTDDGSMITDDICIVLDEAQRDALAASLSAEIANGEDQSPRDDFIELLERVGDDYWVGWSYIDGRDPAPPSPLFTFFQYLPYLVPRLVHIPGPESPVPSPTTVLRPLLHDLVRRESLISGDVEPNPPDDGMVMHGHGPVGGLWDLARGVVVRVSGAYSMAVPRYLDEYHAASITQQDTTMGYPEDRILDALIGELDVALASRDEPSRRRIAPAGEAPIGSNLETRGAGTRRRALLAALELYRDASLWSPHESLVVTVEEPELGLHPGAQRRVAEALAGLPAHGLQVVAVTHSPTLIRHFPTQGIRLVRRRSSADGGSLVMLPEALREIAEDLGVDPSDVLIARRFVVVEGPSDVAVLREWATTLGLEAEENGIQFVAAGGDSRASNLTQFLEVAYEGSSFLVLLDGGRQTDETLRDMQAEYGGRIEVRRLLRDQIEAHFTLNAVRGWLVTSGVDLTADNLGDVDQSLSGGVTKTGLQAISQRLLGRKYRASADGKVIARLMPIEDIERDVQERLMEACLG